MLVVTIERTVFFMDAMTHFACWIWADEYSKSSYYVLGLQKRDPINCCRHSVRMQFLATTWCTLDFNDKRTGLPPNSWERSRIFDTIPRPSSSTVHVHGKRVTMCVLTGEIVQLGQGPNATKRSMRQLLGRFRDRFRGQGHYPISFAHQLQSNEVQ